MSKTTDDILASEFSEQFIELMRNRMIVSYYKYGPIATAYPDKVNAISSLRDRLALYLYGNAERGIAPGNADYLADMANFLMIESLRPAHPNFHLEGTDSDKSSGRVLVGPSARRSHGTNLEL
jgi:hypothetical protein